MLRWIGRGLLALLALAALVLVVLPGETAGLLPAPVLPEEGSPERTVRTVIDSEALIDGVRPTALKEVVWAREDRAKTPLALVYLHGFSASKAELRPVPERVAAAVGANLFFTRLTGHGRDGAAMATARASNWMGDVSEAIAVGQAIGERVVVIGSSMGGALAALTAAQLEDDAAMAGYVLISPAFETRAGGTSLLTMPFARVWLPWLIGAERSWVPHNAAHAEGWTPAYPSAAVVPFAAVVLEAQLTPYDHVTRPLLLLISDEDGVIDPARARQVAGGWGGAVEIEALALGPEDDPDRHVLAGDALSPGMTEAATARIVAWIEARLAAPPSGQNGGDGDGGEAEEGG